MHHESVSHVPVLVSDKILNGSHMCLFVNSIRVIPDVQTLYHNSARFQAVHAFSCICRRVCAYIYVRARMCVYVRMCVSMYISIYYYYYYYY